VLDLLDLYLWWRKHANCNKLPHCELRLLGGCSYADDDVFNISKEKVATERKDRV
jgi:hypothetical protein